MTNIFTGNGAPSSATPAAPAQAPSYGGGAVGPGGARAAPSGPVPTREQTAQMTPTELHNSFARAFGGKEVPVPPNEIAEKMRNAPPSTTPAAPVRVDPVQQFDADMRAAGIQQQPPREPLRVANGQDGFELARNGVRVPNGQSIDPAAIERINTDFRQEFGRLQAELSKTGSDAAKGRIQQQMRELSSQHQAKLAAVMPGEAPAAAPVSEFTPEQWAEGHASVVDAEGFIPMERLNQAGLSGYKLPRFVADQTYHASIFAELAQARAAGITQQQLDAFLRADAVKQGWIKS